MTLGLGDRKLAVGCVMNVRTKGCATCMALMRWRNRVPVLVMVTLVGEQIAYVPGGCGRLG
jgi:hypothetical protein